MYLPKNKIIPNLYTSGGEYQLDGKEYVGNYFKTTFDTYYTGKSPVPFKGGNQRIYPINPDTSLNYPNPDYPIALSENTSDIVRRDSLIDLNEKLGGFANRAYPLNPLDPLYSLEVNDYNYLVYNGNKDIVRAVPISTTTFPNPSDYEKGYFSRYFCVKSNESKFYEIQKQTYDDIISKKEMWSDGMYIAFRVLWYLKGDMEKTFNLNKNLISQSQNRLKKIGLDKFIKLNYLQFFRLHPGVNLINPKNNIRNYLNNESIPTNLPLAYQYGNVIPTQVNPNVPAKQNCSNCIFNKTNFCTKWKANIKHNYWCAAYKGKYGEGRVLGEVQDVPSPSSPSSPQPSYTPPSSTPTQGGGGYSGGGGGGGY